MKKYRFQKGFTLIELLIVIAIISILATIIVVSYSGAQAKSRDNKRKTDVQAIASAYQIHYQETKTWKFSGPELQKLVPAPDPTCNGEGWSCGGTGYFNTENAVYKVSMARALSGLGYLNPAPKAPLPGRDYMKYQSATSISVYAKLENYTAEELAGAQAGTSGSTAVGYGMNYAVTLK